MVYWTKWVNTQKKGMEIVHRLDRTKQGAGATLMDGFVAGYKTGYVVVSKKKIRGWKKRDIK